MKFARQQAFTLVEVVIAMGIIAFAITSMIGLMVVAMQSDKSSGSDTALAAMSRQVFNGLRAMPFSNLPPGTNYYFDRDGSGCAPASAIYGCNVTLTDPPGMAAGNLKEVRMVFTWPYSAVTRPNTNIIQGSIANYGQ